MLGGGYLLCINLHLCALSGRVRGGDCFGAWFWGPHGADGWHSSEALPTDQVAIHRALVDYRSLSVIKLALTQQAAWSCVCRWNTTVSQHASLHNDPKKVGRLQNWNTCNTDEWEQGKQKKTQMHSSDTCSWLNIKARDPLCHSHIPHKLTSTLHAIVCTPVLVTDTEDVYDVII